ncbi:MAG: hypothetical protein ACRD6U_09775 [Nitrososphaeraceae archaeon]
MEFTIPLNKFEKEKKVIELHKQGTTLKDIAPVVHMSFRDISKIIKTYDKKVRFEQSNKENNNNQANRIKKPSLSSLAFKQFRDGKKLTDVAIDLQIPAKKAVKLWSQFLRLEGMYECYEFYQDHSYDIPTFLSIDNFMKRNNIYGKDVVKVLRTANDVNTLNQIQRNLKTEIEKLKQAKIDYNLGPLQPQPLGPLPKYYY